MPEMSKTAPPKSVRAQRLAEALKRNIARRKAVQKPEKKG